MRKLTVVQAGNYETKIAWKHVFGRRKPVVVVKSLAQMYEVALGSETNRFVEIERLVFDEAISADTFLSFVAMLPPVFVGDVVWIRQEGGGYVSSPVPGGQGRVIYRMSSNDLALYLEAHYAIAERTLKGFEEAEIREAIALSSH